jgi:CRP-like cAMP-binding protein
MGAFLANPLIRKMENYTRLSPDDHAVLERVIAERVRDLGAREDLAREGDHPRDVYIVLNGWACRYKNLEDGRRQIIAFFLPGDLCDLNIFLLREMDHSVGTITNVTFAELSREQMDELTTDHPRINHGFEWEALVNAAIQREWCLSLGQRDATERVAHLLCELFVRLRSVGLTKGNRTEFPLTQADLADATGLSVVHVNRTLQELRARKFLTLQGRTLNMLNLRALMSAALFNPNYLHLEQEGAHFDANQ